MTQFSLNDASVVVVIGSGAGGGTVADALSNNGVGVVCLEAGGRLDPADIVTNEAEMFGKLTWLDERQGSGIAPPPFPVWNCKTVGGTTVHWTATSVRLSQHEFNARSHYGEMAGTTLADWPLELADLEPWYSVAEDRLGVTGTHGIERLPASNNFLVFEAGAKRCGYKEINTGNLAINPAPRDGRGSCLQLGFCTSGCAVGAKWSTLYTDIPSAEQSGHFELRTESMAVKLNHDNNGRVTGVDYLDSDGKLHTQAARAVCVAGNTVETTRLLLNSRSGQFPDGLANRSGQVGRNYMRHVMAGVVGVMPGQVNLYRGAHQAGIIYDERHHDEARGFSGGFLFETVNFTPESMARFLRPGGWGKEYAKLLEQYERMAAMLIVGEDPPMAANSISLHPTRKDRYGLPVPVIHYEHHDNSKKMLRYGLDRGRRIYEALGAEQVVEMVDVFPATHNMGTARMGNDPATSVCNQWGQTHDLDNLFISDGSLFPTSGCANPTLTIIALALRQAEYLASQIQSNTI